MLFTATLRPHCVPLPAAVDKVKFPIKPNHSPDTSIEGKTNNRHNSNHTRQQCHSDLTPFFSYFAFTSNGGKSPFSHDLSVYLADIDISGRLASANSLNLLAAFSSYNSSECDAAQSCTQGESSSNNKRRVCESEELIIMVANSVKLSYAMFASVELPS
jgi:hypothetical protein